MNGSGPAIRFADAKAACATVCPDRAEALAVGWRLHAAGWLIPLLEASDSPPSDQAGTRVLGTVFHPTTLTSPGTLIYHTTGTPPPRPLPAAVLGPVTGDDLASLFEIAELSTRLDGSLAGHVAEVILRWLETTPLGDLSRHQDLRIHHAVVGLAMRATENRRPGPHLTGLLQTALHHATAAGHPVHVVIVTQAIADHLAELGDRRQTAELVGLAASIAHQRIGSQVTGGLAHRHAQLSPPNRSPAPVDDTTPEQPNGTGSPGGPRTRERGEPRDPRRDATP